MSKDIREHFEAGGYATFDWEDSPPSADFAPARAGAEAWNYYIVFEVNGVVGAVFIESSESFPNVLWFVDGGWVSYAHDGMTAYKHRIYTLPQTIDGEELTVKEAHSNA